jgi:hypothetical protein
MSIKGENRFDPQMADDLKTDAIGQAELPFRGRQECGHTDRMKLGSHEFDSHNRHHVILKSTDRLHADPALKQRRFIQLFRRTEISRPAKSALSAATRVIGHSCRMGLFPAFIAEKASRKRWIGLMRPFFLQHHEDGLEQDA